MLITGDTHGDLRQRRKKVMNYYPGTSPVIIAGDFGVIWDVTDKPLTGREKEIIYQLNETGRDWLFVDGNHENHHRLAKLPTRIEYGNKVGVVADGLYHLRRGNVYTIEGKTVWVMGGGTSIDKEYRTKDISWWKEEIPSKAEEDHALDQLDKVGWEVDYVVTHAAPLQARELVERGLNAHNSDWYGDTKFKEFIVGAENKFLTAVACDLEFEKWFFGHYHFSGEEGKFRGLYFEIVDLDNS